MTPVEIVKFIEGRRWPLSDEKILQLAISDELVDAGIIFRREVALGDGDVIDILIGDVGVEIKIKGQRRAIYRQCVRYCRHEAVQRLVLATNAAMGMPAAIGAKRVWVASMGKGWL